MKTETGGDLRGASSDMLNEESRSTSATAGVESNGGQRQRTKRFGQFAEDGDLGEVIRASYGLEFGEGGSPMTNQISMNTRQQHPDDDARSSVVNPLFHTSSVSYSGGRGRSVSYSDARRDDMKEEIRVLRGMQRQHEEQRDELLGVLAKEREKYDASQAKTLGLLEKKDDVIDELSVVCDEAHAQIADLERVLEEEKEKRREAEVLLDSEKEIRHGVEEQKKSYDRVVKGLRDEVQVLRDGVAHKAMELDAEKEHRKNVEAHMDDVSQALDAAEEVMGDMERQFAKEKKHLEQRCVAMEEFISEKLGLDIREHVRHLPSLSPGVEDNVEVDGSMESSRLLKANMALEEALVRHALKTRKVGMVVDGHVSEVAVPSFIRDVDSLEEDTVETLKEEIDQLAKAHQMAQQVALQAESELMAAQDRESDLKETLEKMNAEAQQRESRTEEEEQWREDALDKIVDLEDACKSLQESLDASQEEVRKLEESLNQTLDEKREIEKSLNDEEAKTHETFVEMHREIESLRADLFASQRSLSAREAKIASLEAVQKFSLDLSDWETMDISKIDPTSAPVEFLVRSLREAAQMQTELLQSLSEMSYVNEQSQSSFEAMERDMERLLSYLDVNCIDTSEKNVSTFADKVRSARREDIDSLRSQVERAVAIQEGQAEAYCLMAAKVREREAETKDMIQNTTMSLRQNEEFLRNLETALSAMKSGLAKVALVQDGEDKANEVLAVPCTADDALDIAIRVSDTLNDLAQAMSTGAIGPVESQSSTREMQEMQRKYQALVSAYEAAKTESKHARYALEQLKSSMSPQGDVFSRVTTPITANTATSMSTTPNASFLHFVDKFEAVLDESSRQESRIRELEAEKANRSQQAWNSLVAKKMMLQQSHKVWRECKNDIKRLEKNNESYLEKIQELQDELLTAETALESSMKKQALMTERHNEELVKMKNIYNSQVACLKTNSEALKASSEIEIQELIESATLETQEACRRDFEAHARELEVEIRRLQDECRTLEHQRDNVLEDFKRFREVKDASIALLEERLQISPQQEESGRPIQRKDALSVIEEACSSDAVRAVLHQAKFEKSERERLEQEMKHLISSHSSENIPPQSGAQSKQYRDSLRKAEAKIDELSSRLERAEASKSVDPKEMAAWRNEAERLQQDIVNMTLAMR